jgi:hypothetical protein
MTKPRISSRRKLTDRFLRSCEPANQITYWDTLPGFGARVGKQSISFVVIRRLPGRTQPTRVTLGRWPLLDVERARAIALEALGEIERMRHEHKFARPRFWKHPRPRTQARDAARAKAAAP